MSQAGVWVIPHVYSRHATITTEVAKRIRKILSYFGHDFSVARRFRVLGDILRDRREELIDLRELYPGSDSSAVILRRARAARQLSAGGLKSTN